MEHMLLYRCISAGLNLVQSMWLHGSPTVPAAPEKARPIADFKSNIIYVNFTRIWTQPHGSPLWDLWWTT